jgi:hypothetical protein
MFVPMPQNGGQITYRARLIRDGGDSAVGEEE